MGQVLSITECLIGLPRAGTDRWRSDSGVDGVERGGRGDEELVAPGTPKGHVGYRLRYQDLAEQGPIGVVAIHAVARRDPDSPLLIEPESVERSLKGSNQRSAPSPPGASTGLSGLRTGTESSSRQSAMTILRQTICSWGPTWRRSCAPKFPHPASALPPGLEFTTPAIVPQCPDPCGRRLPGGKERARLDHRRGPPVAHRPATAPAGALYLSCASVSACSLVTGATLLDAGAEGRVWSLDVSKRYIISRRITAHPSKSRRQRLPWSESLARRFSARPGKFATFALWVLLTAVRKV